MNSGLRRGLKLNWICVANLSVFEGHFSRIFRFSLTFPHILLTFSHFLSTRLHPILPYCSSKCRINPSIFLFISFKPGNLANIFLFMCICLQSKLLTKAIYSRLSPCGDISGEFGAK